MRRLLPLLLLATACVQPRQGETWLAELWADDPLYGSHRALLTLESGDDEAHDRAPDQIRGGSRYRALSELTGSRLVALWELFASHHGSLMDVAEATVLDDGAVLVTVGTPHGPIAFRGAWTGERFEGTWLAENPPGLSGGFKWERSELSGPLEDYAAILEAFLAKLEERYVFPARLEGDGWRDAVAVARERVAWVRDDLEFFVLCTLMVEELGSALTGAVRQAALPDPGEIEITVRVADGVAWMRTGHLLEALDEIDAAFADVRGARALILDLRGARGLDPTCGRLLAWLCPDQRPVGTMLGRRLADRGPLDDAERDGLPLVSGVYDKHLMRLMLGARGGAAGASEVLEPFRGEVVVLVDERTATALEPVVEFLQREGLATIVGRPTAGEMLDAELYDLPAGWTAVVPLGAYFTWDGRSLDGTGVEPDVLVDRSGALLAALELLGASPGTFSPISP